MRRRARGGSSSAWSRDGDAAVVSDAGTPLVSDPGARVVDAVLEAGHDVVPVPGPSAVLAALVGSGLPADRFVFLGFAPRKGLGNGVLCCSGSARFAGDHRALRGPRPAAPPAEPTSSARAPQDRRVAVAREMTKLHEEFVRGTLAEARAHFGERAPRGEVTLVIDRSPGGEPDESAAREVAAGLLAGGARPSEAVREVDGPDAEVSRNRAYRIVHSTVARNRPETE